MDDFFEGDTFRLPYAFKTQAGDPRPINGWVITGSIRRLGATALAGTLDFSESRNDALGTGFVVVAGFELLTPGTYSCAVTLEVSGGPVDSKTIAAFAIRIKKRLP
jgi:hypothetical protein